MTLDLSNRRIVWNVRDPCLRDLVSLLADDVLSVEDDRAPGRCVDAGQHVEDRCLPRAVGTDESDDLAALHLDVEVRNGAQTAEILREMLDVEESHYALTSFLWRCGIRMKLNSLSPMMPSVRKIMVRMRISG